MRKIYEKRNFLSGDRESQTSYAAAIEPITWYGSPTKSALDASFRVVDGRGGAIDVVAYAASNAREARRIADEVERFVAALADFHRAYVAAIPRVFPAEAGGGGPKKGAAKGKAARRD